MRSFFEKPIRRINYEVGMADEMKLEITIEYNEDLPYRF